MYVKVLRIPGYKDPDEFIKNKSREEFETLIQEALDPIDFEMLVLNSRTGADTVEGKVKTLKALAQKLSEISNPLERELHIGTWRRKCRSMSNRSRGKWMRSRG